MLHIVLEQIVVSIWMKLFYWSQNIQADIIIIPFDFLSISNKIPECCFIIMILYECTEWYKLAFKFKFIGYWEFVNVV